MYVYTHFEMLENIIEALVEVQPMAFGVHFFILESQSIILFSTSRLPRSVEKRPSRLRLDFEIR